MDDRLNSGNSSKWRWIELAVLSSILLVLAVLPSLPGITLCFYKLTTGHACITCGVTHSMWSILHGDFVSAWEFNPMGFIVVPVVIRRIIALAAPKLKLVTIIDNRAVNLALITLAFSTGLLNYYSVI